MNRGKVMGFSLAVYANKDNAFAHKQTETCTAFIYIGGILQN